jgi:hypothetical protein
VTAFDEASAELAAAAARWVIEDGMEYGDAKRRAARNAPARRGRTRVALPSNEAVEDEVRAQLALFHADEQPTELAALRHLALRWMKRLVGLRPHLAGAVWRGTATRRSAVLIDLYADDAKAVEIQLINLGLDYDADDAGTDRRGQMQTVLTLADHCPDLGEIVPLHLCVHDHDELRGALLPDARGRSWRGDTAALERLLAEAGSP